MWKERLRSMRGKKQKKIHKLLIHKKGNDGNYKRQYH